MTDASPRSAPICDVCDGLSWTFQFDFYEAWYHTMSYESLCMSADAGCWSCSLLVRGSSKYIGSSARIRVISGTRRTIPATSSTPLVITIEYEQDSSLYETKVEFYVLENAGCCPPSLGAARHVPITPSSRESFAFIQKQLRQCISSHQLCKSPTCNVPPTRVIHVGTSGSDLRLYEPHGEKLEYVALSHRWATLAMLQTTKDNISAHKNHLRLAELPRTFQDAVHVTRRLGIKYLWIDSLCIIQDSSMDWDREASVIAHTFGNATLVIAADRTSDKKGGFLNNISWSSNKQISVEVASSCHQSRSVFVRPFRQWFRDRVGHRPSAVGSKGPLGDRGWTFQERLVARRIIHFTDAELVWECGKSQCCQCRLEEHEYRPADVWRSPLFRLNHIQTSNSKADLVAKGEELIWIPKYNELPTAHSLPPCYAGPSSFYCQWDRVVVEITRRKFTFAADILPAIAGLADTMRRCTGDDYHFGLWYNDLAGGLLWFAQKPAIAARAWSNAPSWSWAAIEAPINYFLRSRFDILDSFIVYGVCEVTRGGSLTAVGKGAISLHGWLVPVCRLRKSRAGRALEVRGQEEWKYIRDEKGRIRHDLKGMVPLGRVRPDSNESMARMLTRANFYCLLIARIKHIQHSFDLKYNVSWTLDGILLERISEGSFFFHRLGHFTTANETPWLNTGYQYRLGLL